jgi:hypothetical protein
MNDLDRSCLRRGCLFTISLAVVSALVLLFVVHTQYPDRVILRTSPPSGEQIRMLTTLSPGATEYIDLPEYTRCTQQMRDAYKVGQDTYYQVLCSDGGSGFVRTDQVVPCTILPMIRC